ncbi:MAG: recombinase family protein [Candidatus Dormibacteria bacterium]
MHIGYGLVSSPDQNRHAWRDPVQAVGCDKALVDSASGKLACLPELSKAVPATGKATNWSSPGLTRLDGPWRTSSPCPTRRQHTGVDLGVIEPRGGICAAVAGMFFHILGAIAEFEPGVAAERTDDGPALARGLTGGVGPS